MKYYNEVKEGNKMSKRNEYEPQQSPLKILLYILTVLVLLGGITYLVKYTKQKQNDFVEQIKALNEDELAAQQTEKAIMTETTVVTEQEQSSSNAESEAESESENITEKIRDKHILVLNRSGKDGIAARWKEKLKSEGYQNVSIASYPGAAIEQTIIYAKDKAEITELEELFSNPEVTGEKFTADISDEESNLEDVEIYIVIGTIDSEE